jgi:hypothetical protein
VRHVLIAAVLAAGVAIPPIAGVAHAQDAASTRDRTEQAFTQGGQIFMDLSAGGYSITGTDEAKIRVKWSTQDPSQMDDVDVRIGVEGKAARINTDGPSDNFHVQIEIPKRADLTIRLSAGEITVRGIEGHKDVSAWAGELKIGIGKAVDYRSADASVTAGEIDGAPFGVTKGGVFRSFSQEGKGKYNLKVRLTAGKIVLSEEASPARPQP